MSSFLSRRGETESYYINRSLNLRWCAAAIEPPSAVVSGGRYGTGEWYSHSHPRPAFCGEAKKQGNV